MPGSVRCVLRGGCHEDHCARGAFHHAGRPGQSPDRRASRQRPRAADRNRGRTGVARSRRAADCRDGCCRRRHAGAVLRPARAARLPGRDRGSDGGTTPTTVCTKRSRRIRGASPALPPFRPPTPPRRSKELERAVKTLGFKGAMINGHTQGEFLDDKKYWPIFECAACARRADLSSSARSASGRDEGLFRGLSRIAYGGLGLRHRDLHAISCARSLAGVFDAYPKLHLHPRPSRRGPAVLARTAFDDHTQLCVRAPRPEDGPRQYLTENLVDHLQRQFLDAGVRVHVMALGIDNVLFSSTGLTSSNVYATKFLRELPLANTTKRRSRISMPSASCACESRITMPSAKMT